MTGIRIFQVAWTACLLTCIAHGQHHQVKPQRLAELELAADTATTTDDGYPSTLRVTLKNVGIVTIDMPALALACAPDGGVKVNALWNSDDDHEGSASGMGCGVGDQGSLVTRIKRNWIRLRPGESMTLTEQFKGKFDETKRGTVHYGVEYDPPEATKAELAELTDGGYVIPTEKLKTAEQTFHVR